MRSRATKRDKLAMVYLDLLAPIVRADLLVSPEFEKAFNIPTVVTLRVGDTGLVFDRDQVFSAIQALSASGIEQTLADQAGRSWILRYDAENLDPQIRLVSGDTVLPPLEALLVASTKQQDRLAELQRRQRRSLLPEAVVETWRLILEGRALSCDEFFQFKTQFDASPSIQAARLCDEMQAGESTYDSFVPRSRQYWITLTGSEPAHSLREFVQARKRVESSLFPSTDRREQLKMLLLAGAHPHLAPSLSALGVSEGELSDVFDWLIEHGDAFSGVAAIEATIAELDRFPNIAPKIAALYDKLVPQDVDARSERYELLFATTAFVDELLSRNRTLINKPPYYRRLCSLAQASLIERVLKRLPVDVARFKSFAAEATGRYFLAQAMIDARLEPYWTPNFMMPQQLWREAAGRIRNIAIAHRDAVEHAGLLAKLTMRPDGQCPFSELMLMSLPGPLEGLRDELPPLPDDLKALVLSALNTEPPSEENYTPLANVTFLYAIPEEIQRAAVDRMRASPDPKAAISSKTILRLYAALATTAAITRSTALAEELFKNLRRHVALYPDDVELQFAQQIALTACAAYADKKAWRIAIGDFYTDMSFRVRTSEEASILLGMLLSLLYLDPELWVTCGKAEAALSEVAAS